MSAAPKPEVLQYMIPSGFFLIPLFLHIYTAIAKRGGRTFTIPGCSRIAQVCIVISISQLSRIIPAISAMLDYDGPSTSDTNVFIWELVLDAVFLPPLMFILSAVIMSITISCSNIENIKYLGKVFKYSTLLLVLSCIAVVSLYAITFVLLATYKFKQVVREDQDERFRFAASVAEYFSAIVTVIFTIIMCLVSIVLLLNNKRNRERTIPAQLISLSMLTSAFLSFDLLVAFVMFLAKVTFSRVMIIFEPIALFIFLILVFVWIGPMNKEVVIDLDASVREDEEDEIINVPTRNIVKQNENTTLLTNDQEENEKL